MAAIKTMTVGSYSVPDWYHPLYTLVGEGKMQEGVFREAQQAAARAAIKDMEAAGLDWVGDGELCRRCDNYFGPPNAMINAFASRIPGFSPSLRPRPELADPDVEDDEGMPAPVVSGALSYAPLGLVDEFRTIRAMTDRKIKVTMTGPHMFTRVAFNDHYPDLAEFGTAMADIINQELRQLDDAGCDAIQLDEPVLWFMPDDHSWALELVNRCFAGVNNALKVVHVCQGNYNANPDPHVGIRVFPSVFDNILPVFQHADVDLFLMAFSGLEEEDISMLGKFPENKCLGVGSINVHSHDIEHPEQVADTLKRVMAYIPQDRLLTNPDCGLNHLPRDIAFAKLGAMVQGAHMCGQH